MIHTLSSPFFERLRTYRVFLARALVVGATILLIVGTAFTFLYNVGISSIDQDSDEVVYARVVQTLYKSWDSGEGWFPLRHGKIPFYEKPPVRFVIGAAVLSWLGNENFAFRIVDGSLGIVAVLLSVLLAFQISRSIPLSIVTGFICLTIPEWVLFAHSFRRISLDGMLTVTLLLSYFAAWRVAQGWASGRILHGTMLLFSLLCGFASLVKSIAGLVPVVMLALFLLFTFPGVKPSLRNSVYVALCLAVGPLILGMYCGILWGISPSAIKTFIGTEIIHRASQGFDGHNVGEPYFYFYYLIVRGAFLPTGALLIGVAAVVYFGILNRIREGNSTAHQQIPPSIDHLFLLCMGCGPVLLFSLSSAKVPWYLNPYAPLLIIMGLVGIRDLYSWICRKNAPVYFQAFAGILLTVVVIQPLIPRFSRTISFVRHDVQRIPIDRLVDDARQSKSRVIVVDNIISGRSSPIKGRFNVEGVYREMLGSMLIAVDDIQGVEIASNSYVVVPTALKDRLPPGWKLWGVLPPLLPRLQEAVVVHY